MTDLILVTGATGTVGSEVVKQLAEKGVKVKACCHTSGKAEKMQRKNVEVVEVDYQRSETLKAAFTGVTKLFLLTPVTQNMVEITGRLVEEAKKARVKHIVKLSVMGADAKPGMTLGRWHRQAEQAIEASGIPYTHLRPNFFMQNFVTFNRDVIRNQGAFYMAGGDAKGSTIDVRDIAAVAVQALTTGGHEGKAYTLTGPDALSNQQIAKVLSEAIGKPIRYVNISDEQAREGMKQQGMPDWLIDAFRELYAAFRAGAMEPVSRDVEKILGQKPLSFRQFAGDYAEMFKT